MFSNIQTHFAVHPSLTSKPFAMTRAMTRASIWLIPALVAVFMCVATWQASASSQDSLIQVFRNHTSAVTSVAFSNSGSKAVSTSSDGTAKVWDLIKRENTVSVKNPFGKVNAAVFSPNESHFASAGRDGKIRIWNTETGRLAQTLIYHYGSVLALDYSPDGTRLASGSMDHTVIIWNLDKGAAEIVIKSPQSSVTDVTFSESGSLLAIGTNDGTISVWDLDERSRVLSKRLYSRPVLTVGFYDNEENVLGAYLSGRMVNLKIATGAVNKRFGQPGYLISSANFHHLHDVAAVGSETQGVALFNISNNRSVDVIEKPQRIRAIAISPDLSMVLTGDRSGRVALWDTSNASLFYKEQILRDLQYALSADTPQALSDFIMLHQHRCLLPSDCARVERAVTELWNKVIESDGGIAQSYGFIQQFSDYPEAEAAKDYIFELIDRSGNLAGHLWFAEQFPTHPNAADALRVASEIGFDISQGIGTASALAAYVRANPFAAQSNAALDQWSSLMTEQSKALIVESDTRGLSLQVSMLFDLIHNAQKRNKAIYNPKTTGDFLVASRGSDILRTQHVNNPRTVLYQGSDAQLSFEKNAVRAQSYRNELSQALRKEDGNPDVKTLSRLYSELIDTHILQGGADLNLQNAYAAEFKEWEELLSTLDL